jgi:hypothetical protein
VKLQECCWKEKLTQILVVVPSWTAARGGRAGGESLKGVTGDDTGDCEEEEHEGEGGSQGDGSWSEHCGGGL